MATLRSNTLVKIIIPVVALGAVAIGIRACSDKRVQQEAAVTILPTLTPEQLRELGVEGDTAQDTLNTLVGKLGEIQRQQGDILEENKQLKEENKTLQA
ncbi:TIGR03752 family integrating conjugative element protein, partial [Salmonella enterica subsp. enterica serovar Brandenburg]|nr:TIGR03752 family integrating conjugative element protein [Salmonella enterica subsp. enterica serovar Brandenburg]